MIESTLCYIKKDDSYLMLHRTKKKNDVNEGKWIGVGGKLEAGETPEECVNREVFEETGLKLSSYSFRGIINFASEGWEDEKIYLYTSDSFLGELTECKEGVLEWIKENDIFSLNLWEGDRIFLKRLLEGGPFFTLNLSYKGDELISYEFVD